LNIEGLQKRIREAAEARVALRLRGGGSKDFYGNDPRGELVDTRAYAGIVSYEPTELVVTARCGTPLAELDQALQKNRQCLGFEPPHFGGATLGGCVAAGLSGPRRASAGAVRDFVLGAKIVDGRGRLLSFGGQVMKNVAGYDVSRLLAGSLGTLGLIAEISVKVMPLPSVESSLRLAMHESEAIEALNRWAAQPLPITATAWHEGEITLRLSGAASAVRSATGSIGGEALAPSTASDFWTAVREQRHSFFDGGEPLWRIAVPSTAPRLSVPGRTLMEWSAGLRWLKTGASVASVREAAARAGGHAALFRGGDRAAGVFAPLDAALLRLHRELKAAFDPAGILNPGRLYPGL
jgi:glycolate oxidase FAD binding subunit